MAIIRAYRPTFRTQPLAIDPVSRMENPTCTADFPAATPGILPGVPPKNLAHSPVLSAVRVDILGSWEGQSCCRGRKNHDTTGKLVGGIPTPLKSIGVTVYRGSGGGI